MTAILALTAAMLLAKFIHWSCIAGKSRIAIDPDYESDLSPATRPWRRITTDEERP